MSDVAGYWKRKLADKPSAEAWESAYQRAAVRAGLVSRPIVPRYEPAVWDDPGPDIDADAALVWVNPPPPYFWLGRDAE